MLIIGSRAAEINGVDLKRSLSNDFDVIMTVNEANRLGVDSSVLHGNNGVYDYWIANDNPLVGFLEKVSFGKVHVANLPSLHALKLAQRHVWRGDVKYSFKALWDCCILSELTDNIKMKNMVDELKPFVREWGDFLLEEMNTKPPRKLNETKENFFSDLVEYYYDHDSIHEAMAHKNEPMYKKHLKGQVLMDNKSFESDTIENKRLQVLEESYVIALERIIIPRLKKDQAFMNIEKIAFEWALTRVCTNLCGGFFREFAADNYKWLIENYNKNYLDVFFNNSNKLKRFK